MLQLDTRILLVIEGGYTCFVSNVRVGLVGSNEEDRIDRIRPKDGCDREMNWLTVSIYSGESLCGQELKSLLGGGCGPNEPLLDT